MSEIACHSEQRDELLCCPPPCAPDVPHHSEQHIHTVYAALSSITHSCLVAGSVIISTVTVPQSCAQAAFVLRNKGTRVVMLQFRHAKAMQGFLPGPHQRHCEKGKQSTGHSRRRRHFHTGFMSTLLALSRWPLLVTSLCLICKSDSVIPHVYRKTGTRRAQHWPASGICWRSRETPSRVTGSHCIPTYRSERKDAGPVPERSQARQLWSPES